MAYYLHSKLTAIDDAIARGLTLMFSSPEDAQNTRKIGCVLGIERYSLRDLQITFKPSQAESRNWKQRERDRFDRGDYMHVPWNGQHYSEPDAITWHYPHLSIKTPGLLAYTKTEEHGVLDRQTTIKPGKYLTEFWSKYLTTDQIASYVAQCVAYTADLQLAQTPKDCETIYIHGPRSCMSRSANRYQGHVHPARVYAGPHSDLTIAYQGDLSAGKVSARCVVWPAKKIAVRVYPDMNAPLVHVLKAAGYTIESSYSDVLEGAKITAIEDSNDHGFIMPYIDGMSYAYQTQDGESMVLTNHCRRPDGCVGSGYGTQQTQDSQGDTIAAGVTDPSDETDDETVYCTTCDRSVDSDDYDNDRDACNRCAGHLHDCSSCGGLINDNSDNYIMLLNDRMLCESCESDALKSCEIEDCDETWIDDAEFTRTEQRIRTRDQIDAICRHCATKFARCASCDNYTSIDSVTCEDCASTAIVRPACTDTLPLPLDVQDETETEVGPCR